MVHFSDAFLGGKLDDNQSEFNNLDLIFAMVCNWLVYRENWSQEVGKSLITCGWNGWIAAQN